MHSGRVLAREYRVSSPRQHVAETVQAQQSPRQGLHRAVCWGRRVVEIAVITGALSDRRSLAH